MFNRGITRFKYYIYNIVTAVSELRRTEIKQLDVSFFIGTYKYIVGCNIPVYYLMLVKRRKRIADLSSYIHGKLHIYPALFRHIHIQGFALKQFHYYVSGIVSLEIFKYIRNKSAVTEFCHISCFRKESSFSVFKLLS